MYTNISKDTIFIIDGSYLLYRSFYALKPLYTTNGTPTQATYGFCRTIKKFIDKFDPQNLIVAWDTKGKTFRSSLYENYKITRQSPPNELFIQKKDIINFLNLIGVCQVSKEGYEADDIIYSITKELEEQKIIIVCPDKDLFQLLSEKILIYDPFKEQMVNENLYEAARGFPVKKLHFYHSILGDTSDNIPGVDGIGEKTAKELVLKFESLNELYENLETIEKNRTRKLLETGKDNAFLSYKLFELSYVNVNIKNSNFKFYKTNWQNAENFFKQLEFKSLYKELETHKESQMTITTKTSQIPKEPEIIKKNDQNWNCIIVRSNEQLEKMIEEIKKSRCFALDTETTGGNPLQDDIVGFSVAVNDTAAYYVPLAHEIFIGEMQLDRDKTLKTIAPILMDLKIKKILHNAKFDVLVLSQYNIWTNGIVFDTLLAANLVKQEWQKNNLKSLSEYYLSEQMQRFKEVIGTKYKNFSQVPIEDGAKYGAHDALQTFKLKPILEKKLDANQKLKSIFCNLEMPVSFVLTKMEKTGITLDVDVVKNLDAKVIEELQCVEKKIFAALEAANITGFEKINFNSPRQIESLLFDQLKLTPRKKSATGKRSTDQEVLEELKHIHPIPAMILQHRELSKLKNTYIDPLPNYINNKTGRIHTSYSQTLVATGRISSQEPNLQNIPVTNSYGLKLRDAFIPPTGYKFMSADYSQIELRVLAHMSKDKNLIDAFLNSKDIHSQTASQIFGISINDVTQTQRQLGKRINFSIIYGLTPYGLSKDLHIKPSEAKEYIDKYFQQYPKVAEWIENTTQDAIKNGYTQTWLGRRRYVPELSEKNKFLFEAGKRIAINSPIQGTAAEIMKLAMIKIDDAITKKNLDANLVLQIHDELLIQFRECIENEITQTVKKELESVVNWEIPFNITIRTGKSWGDVTK